MIARTRALRRRLTTVHLPRSRVQSFYHCSANSAVRHTCRRSSVSSSHSPCLTRIAAATYALRTRAWAPANQAPSLSSSRTRAKIMDLPSRLPSPWSHEYSPQPSPGPPPTPAAWMPYEQWTSPQRRGPAHVRSLPLFPQSQMQPEQNPRRMNTVAPLPSDPEFLRKLESHPMIIQRKRMSEVTGDSDEGYDGDTLRTPSPASSLELVHPYPASKQADDGHVFEMHPPLPPPPPPPPALPPVPFPHGSGFSTPVLCASPRPLPGVGSPHASVLSVPSTTDSSPARTPDSAAALAMSMSPAPSALRALAQAQVQGHSRRPLLPKLSRGLEAASSPPAPLPAAPPAPVPMPTPAPAPAPVAGPPKNGVVLPRARLPALRGSGGLVPGLSKTQIQQQAQIQAQPQPQPQSQPSALLQLIAQPGPQSRPPSRPQPPPVMQPKPELLPQSQSQPMSQSQVRSSSQPRLPSRLQSQQQQLSQPQSPPPWQPLSRSSECPRHPRFYVTEGMVVLKVSITDRQYLLACS